MLFYNLPAFAKDNADAFLAGLARSHHLLRKVCIRYTDDPSYLYVV
jgi:hypothetical protein